MEDSSVPGADGFKHAEAGTAPDGSRGGRPIRKRAYHRALKRGEAWAVSERGTRETIAILIKFAKRQYEEMLMPSPFAYMLKPKAAK